MQAGIVKAAKDAIDVLLRLKGDSIVLTAAGGVQRPGGGFDFSDGGTVRDPQVFAFRDRSSSTPTKAGESRKDLDEEQIMTGRFDAEVEPGDRFERNGIAGVVDKVTRNEYKTVCEATLSVPEAAYDGA